MLIARPLQIFRDHLSRISERADGNYNAGDFRWALDRAIEQAEEEDSLLGEPSQQPS